MGMLSDTEVPYLLECDHYGFDKVGKRMKDETDCRTCNTPRRIVKSVGRTSEVTRP